MRIFYTTFWPWKLFHKVVVIDVVVDDATRKGKLPLTFDIEALSAGASDTVKFEMWIHYLCHGGYTLLDLVRCLRRVDGLSEDDVDFFERLLDDDDEDEQQPFIHGRNHNLMPVLRRLDEPGTIPKARAEADTLPKSDQEPPLRPPLIVPDERKVRFPDPSTLTRLQHLRRLMETATKNPVGDMARGMAYRALFYGEWPGTGRRVYEMIVDKAKAAGHLLERFSAEQDLSMPSNPVKFNVLIEQLAQGQYTLAHLAAHLREAGFITAAAEIAFECGDTPPPPPLTNGNGCTVPQASTHIVPVLPPIPADGEPSAPDGADACVICMDRAPTVVFVPCGHLLACITCAHTLKNGCPTCRKPFTQAMRVYKQ